MTSAKDKPSALVRWQEIQDKLQGKRPLFFLDYDGTLSPITAHPKDARLPPKMKEVLEDLSRRYFTAVISGRALADIKELLGDMPLYISGSHGFVIETDAGVVFRLPEAARYRKDLEEAYLLLKEKISSLPGVVLENKDFSIAIHDRMVEEGFKPIIRTTVAETSTLFPRLKMNAGKCLFELKPALDWDKGKAVQWILDSISFDPKRECPIVIGDDVTDEDAFRAVKGNGVSIFVMGEKTETHADYILQNTEEVALFLQLFSTMQ
ncbi:trehalose-phosphatase [Estrella lausannensis]|uniref:Trehalose 6-phosphate phosphatase n=1 Tax=Estrella lausannensis TaxID=483423 RepID=A0A0H5DS64_9BACT|nr:trehalose-phosphatase [Estrella lausannensis]CRX39113.1 Trehalose-phosphate phosphatase [Estrella lausannensis]